MRDKPCILLICIHSSSCCKNIQFLPVCLCVFVHNASIYVRVNNVHMPLNELVTICSYRIIKIEVEDSMI